MVKRNIDALDYINEHLEQRDLRFKKRQVVFSQILASFQMGNVKNIFESILENTCRYLSFNRAALFEDTEDGDAGVVIYEWCAKGDTHYFKPGVANPYFPNYAGINRQLKHSDTCFLTLFSDTQFSLVPTENVFSVVIKIWLNNQRYGICVLDGREKPIEWDEDAIWFLSCIKSVITMVVAQNNSLIMSVKYSEQLYYMVYYDQLTHLPNRYKFDEEVTRAIIEAQKEQQHGYVINLDLDDFKIVNDSYGHKTGDLFLVEFSRFLQGQLSLDESVFRLDGDEFAILLKPGQAHDIEKIIQSVLERVHSPWRIGSHQFYNTVSIAVVQYPNYGITADEVMRNADIALNMAKQSGRNCHLFYTQDLKQDPLHRIELERELRDAIGDGFRGFKPHYQPVIEMADGSIRSAEALARWQDTNGTPVSPADFIPLAEYLGLVVPIGEFMLMEAATLCKKINDMGLSNFSIGINVSMRQIRQPDFTKRVMKILEKTGVNYSNIVLEVTESLAAPDMGCLSTAFQELRNYGIKIALDDFGTGYSSLSYLQQMPIDIIKIDRSFVENITSDDYSNTFVNIISDLGHALGRRVCIEGVETQEQLAICKNANADCIQGYLFYSARTAEELISICQKELEK